LSRKETIKQSPLKRVYAIITATSPKDKIMSNISRITVDPNKCGGRPCIRGLRIRVKDILEMLASGMTNEEILHDFPYLETDDISAALEYAAKQVDHPILQAA
jgi:uncharacterized protein (DUF433 family)